MYLHLGQNVVVEKKSIIGIFDLDNCTGSRVTRDFLSKAERGGQIRDVSGELPKVFALWENDGETRVYLSQLSSATLLRRWDDDML